MSFYNCSWASLDAAIGEGIMSRPYHYLHYVKTRTITTTLLLLLLKLGLIKMLQLQHPLILSL